MQFHRIQRKRPLVPILPMIDIIFVVLVFVIVTSQQRQKRHTLRIEFPTVREVPSQEVSDPRSVIAVDALGNITLDGLPVPEGLLKGYLEAFKRQNPGRKLELEADRLLPLERLLQVLDALTEAGISIKEVPARIKVPEKD
ncbi:MAG: biopolymer transporter ExbD [Akkermansiaceae bacterium]|nr:biopolymer transporter ExbD [Akkermansiaceae bacterium]